MTSVNKKILLNGQEVTYTHRKTKRARRIRVVVYCDATVMVSSPRHVNNIRVESFLREKAAIWILKKIKHFQNLGGRVWHLQGNQEEYRLHKAKAYETAARTVEEMNKFYNFAYKKITIRNQKLRWGSCSLKGNLNFNYKLIFLEKREMEYLAVHELCHLQEFNHSKNFWSLVQRAIPEYKEICQRLVLKRI